MIFDRFRVQVLWRVLLLFGALICSVFFWQQPGYWMTSILSSALVAVLFWRLLNYVERTNRELERFFLAIQYDDFSQSFHLPNLGKSFQGLGKALESVMEHFRETRKSREEFAQFSQTVIQQVPVAVLVIESDGLISLSNQKARHIFGGQSVRRAEELALVNEELLAFIECSRSGASTLIQTRVKQQSTPLMVSVTHFAMEGRLRKIVTLQNIRSELDRQEVQAWQDLIRVLSHEILNSITPITSLSHSAGGMLRSLADGSTQVQTGLLDDIACGVETIARRSDGAARLCGTLSSGGETAGATANES